MKLRKLIFATTAMAMLAGPAMADERAKCEDNIRVNGAIMRASMMCKVLPVAANRCRDMIEFIR